MTISVKVVNQAPERGRFLEITVFTYLAPEMDPDTARMHGITAKIFEFDGRNCVLQESRRLGPGQSHSLFLHDNMSYIAREV